ncbi:hypothetical protein IQ235_13875 [Oscillatoriales cyanobacterium LEGE 11467]|uniref:Uncharacterized protein n=1 Tax=Zarconia navalis LEGE 11467 TaxID=1828826 RepID=A0A928VZ04_9CYAN|nr:Npun_F0494 family protein [Zarconia navalis]MBE9041868.1 hypothetical protein [Zarconia navalis LEGE 11467]
MTAAKTAQSIQYSTSSLERARRAMRCAPFQLPWYAAVKTQGVFLGAIAGESGVERQYTRSPLSELVAENHLLWLIDVGVLRREVDGQGITDSFRLTPLGRQLTAQWQENPTEWKTAVSPCDRLFNAARRWLRLPF